MNILYNMGDTLYINITNKCQCNCVFCIRNEYDSVRGNESLWLDHEPEVQEVIEAFKKCDLDKYEHIVFCGYGEPLLKLEKVIEVCKYIRSITNKDIRINTNGLCDLVYNKPTAHLLEGLVDSISISLNAPSAEEYLQISKPPYGLKSFEALLRYAEDCKKYIKEVKFSVVDVISEEQIERCKNLASSMGIPLRVRHKDEDQ
nr:TIGR04100 family radical SAM protein [Hathewaya proteolytica]